MWSVQFIKFFGCRKNKWGSTETYTHIQKGSSFSFVSVTLSYLYSSNGCFGNSKTQESGSRFKGCHHQSALQSVTHKSCLRVERCFFFFLSHTPYYPHTTPLSPQLQQDNKQVRCYSRQNHILCIHGTICVIGIGMDILVVWLHCLFLNTGCAPRGCTHLHFFGREAPLFILP